MIRKIFAIARRELRGFLDHPTAYVLVVAFLGVSLYLTFRSVYGMGLATLRPFFDLLPIFFAVLVPAITMRSLAEERRGRTLDWLVAQPVSELQIVLGKFAGSWLFVLLALAGTIPTAWGIALVSDADPGIMVAQYVGAGLLAAQLTAIGLWASSITRNQITAFIVAAMISFLLFLIGLTAIQIGVPPVVAGVLVRLSVLTHFENVARGVIDVRDVVYFLSTAALFLALAVAAVTRIRLSPQQKDSMRLGTGTAVVAVIVVAVNLLGGQIHGRLDLTRDGLYTLSPSTRDLLRDLDDIVHITFFVSDELPPEVQVQVRDVRDLLTDMRRAGRGNLVFTEVDPDRDAAAAAEAASFNIQPLEFNVMRDDEFQLRRGYYGIAVTYAAEREIFPAIQRTDDLEFRMASAIAAMTADTRPVLAFASDGGARPPSRLYGLQQSLGDRYELRPVTLANDSLGAVRPDSVDVLVLAGPTQPLDSAAVQRLETYMDAGGAALLLVDPVEIDVQTSTAYPVATGLEALLERRGVRVSNAVVVDQFSSGDIQLGQGIFGLMVPYPPWPILRPVTDHIVTRGLGALTLGWAAPLEIVDSTTATPLWTTSEYGSTLPPTLDIDPQQDWEVPEESYRMRFVGAAVDPGAVIAVDATDAGASASDGPGRMIVIGDVTFMDQEFVQVNPQNLAFLANSVDWLAQDEALIHIRSKDRMPPNLQFDSDVVRQVLKWGNLAGMPLLFALVGLLRVTGRKRRAEKRWNEIVQP